MKFLSNVKTRLSGLIHRIGEFISPKYSTAKEKSKNAYKSVMRRVERRPMLAFLGLLLILLGLIILSNFINKPSQSAQETSIPSKEVQVYSIGSTPKITVQAVIEKSGVIKIVSLGSGVVGTINVEVGQDVRKGTNLVQLVSNYEGGNAPAVQAQLAYVQYKNVLDTFNTQKEIIAKQKELAQKQDENNDDLREIADNSLTSTRSLIELNNSILSSLEAQQAELETANVGGANDAAILQTRQLRSQFMAANNQLSTGLENSELAAGSENPQAEMSDITREITIKQLEVQEKALELNKEVSRLNSALAQISAAIMHPVSPVAGVVERIYVREGQAVNPGTPIAQISGDSQSLIAVALLSREISDAVSRSMVSTLHVGNETFEAVPFYVSKDATDGSLYSVQYAIPEELSSMVTDKGYILVEIPIDFPQTGSAVPFIPIDAVFQTLDEAFVFVARDGKAESRKVEIGNVVGRYVEVKKGLGEGDQVILNRNVIAGDPVKLVTSD